MGSAAEVPADRGPHLVATLAIAALAAIAVGCGGGTSASGGGGGSTTEQTSPERPEATTPATSMTKAQYVAWLNHTCRRSWPTILHNAAEYRRHQKPDLSREARVEQTVRFSYMAGFDYFIFSKVNAWGPPGKEHRPEGKQMINAMKKAVEDGLHRVWIGSLKKLAAVFADYNRIARQYGVDQCLVAGAHIPRL